MLFKKTPLYKNIDRSKVKEWKTHHAKINHKETVVVTLKSNMVLSWQGLRQTFHNEKMVNPSKKT